MVLDEDVAHVGQVDVALAFGATNPRWREADKQLLRIAKRRAALDAEELKWLLIARESGAHRELGFGSFREYLERRLGYSPRTARERIRVAEKLQELPKLREALERGETCYSAVRELTRVADAANEQQLLDDANGKTVREVEDLVAGHEPRPRRLVLELQPEVYAQFLEAKRQLQEQTTESLDDSAVMTALLAGDARPRHQLAVHVCVRCDAATVDAAGEVIDIDRDALALARCDAAHVGHDGKVTIDIPRRVRRAVETRDHHRCRVPGCRASIGLHLHHLDPRAQGGTHEAANLILLCATHHDAHHRGRLRIIGTRADRLTFGHADRTGYGEHGLAATAKAVLRELGYSPVEAARAVTEACVSPGYDLEALIRASLRACLGGAT